MDTNNFVAIDFEKLSDSQLSVCEVGLVEFKDGKEVSQFHSYINPVTGITRNFFSKDKLRHISDEDLLTAPTYKDLFEQLLGLIKGKILVVHQKSADLNYIYHLEKHFSLPKLYSRWSDTLEIAGKCNMPGKLPELYALCVGESFLEHHKALEDARACGRIFAYFCSNFDIGKFICEEEYVPCNDRKSSPSIATRHTQHGTTNVSPDGLVFNHDQITSSSFFREKNVVLSGMSQAEKNRIGEKLNELGAKCTSGPSCKTNVFIIESTKVGPSKKEKAKKYQAETGLLVITKDYFLELVQG